MESIDDARGDGQDTYEEVWLPTFPDLSPVNTVARYATEHLSSTRMLGQIAAQFHNTIWAGLPEQFGPGSILRMFEQNRSAPEQAKQYFNTFSTLNQLDSAFGSIFRQPDLSFGLLFNQQWMHNLSAPLRQAKQFTSSGRWVRVKRTRASEDPPSPTFEEIELDRSTRGRPRKGDVESLINFVRAHRLAKGDNPTKWYAANVLHVVESTIDNWLRYTPFKNWKTLLASLV